MKTFLGIVLASAVALLSACGGSDSPIVNPGAPAPAPAPETVQLAQTSTVAGLTVFYQQGTVTVASDGGTTEQYAAIGSPNCVDLNNDFSFSDGCSDQFDGALAISIESIAAGTTTVASGSFPNNQNYSELTFYTPEYGAANGSVGAVFLGADRRALNPVSTDTIAWMVPSADSRLQQTVTFPVGAGSLNLTWSASGRPQEGNLSGEPYFFRVVLRNSAGSLVATLYERSDSRTIGTGGSADVTAYRGQSLLLSFEVRSVSDYISDNGLMSINSVSLLDGSSQLIANGDFQAGATGWITNRPTLSQNVSSGTRSVANLTVRRSVYAPPTEKWARWADVYTNPTSTTISATVTYYTDLGSDDAGIIYNTPGANGKAITIWDGDGYDRDVAMIFGNNAVVSYVSDDGLGNENGDEEVTWYYVLTIPPNSSATVIHFIYLSVDMTGLTPGATIATRATNSDNAAVEILNNFRSNVKYRHGLTQQQLDTIVNF
jgi:hypothetical protein